ncbi:Uncharacterised protein [Brevundimonas vancanneytii]|uniref:Uncharacterized protein n=1 Tax=Brevundimonas vancanneytii TaxID=1325724 RepID=A0A4P1K1S9_9CAUL|nr:Uncharacterised protein [Brevundimonas vancanneytii]
MTVTLAPGSALALPTGKRPPDDTIDRHQEGASYSSLSSTARMTSSTVC